MLDLTGYQFNNTFTCKLDLWLEKERRDDTVTIKIGMPSLKTLRRLLQIDKNNFESVFDALFCLMENARAELSDGKAYHISRETLEDLPIDVMIELLQQFVDWVNEVRKRKN